MKECPPDRTQIARDILKYLSGRPEGEDTFESVIQHRLPAGPTGQQTTLVKEVVSDLVTQGRIEKIRREDRTFLRVRSGR